MNFEELRRIWREHNDNPESETGDENMTIEQTVDVLRQTLQKTHRQIDRRDLLESGIAITMIFFFGFAFTQVPTVMSKSGCVVIIAGLLVIIYRLRRSRHTEDTTDSTLPLDQFCRIESECLAQEARLLRTVPLWYIAPCLIGANLMFFGVAGLSTTSAIYLTATSLFCFWVYRANRKVAVQTIEPLKKEVKGLLSELEAENDSAES